MSFYIKTISSKIEYFAFSINIKIKIYNSILDKFKICKINIYKLFAYKYLKNLI